LSVTDKASTGEFVSQIAIGDRSVTDTVRFRGGIMPAKWQTWVPFKIDKFRGSPAVQAMHPAARWGFWALLASEWQTEDCTVPDDPIELAELSGLGDELWAKYGPRIVRKFECVAPVGADGSPARLRNAVLFEEWREAKRIYEARLGSAQKTNAQR